MQEPVTESIICHSYLTLNFFKSWFEVNVLSKPWDTVSFSFSFRQAWRNPWRYPNRSLFLEAHTGTTSPGRAASEKSTVCKASSAGASWGRNQQPRRLLCICPTCCSSISLYLLCLATVGALRLTVAFLKLLFHRPTVKIIPKLTKGWGAALAEELDWRNDTKQCQKLKVATTRVCFLLCLTKGFPLSIFLP